MRRHDICHCGNRNRKDTVRTVDLPFSLTELREHHIFYAKAIQTDADGKDIHDRIYGADLMEMYVLHGRTMRFCLCLRKDPKDLLRRFLCPCRHIRARNDRKDLRKPAVLMVVFVMSMPVPVWIISIQIRHVMVMVFMCRIQPDIKITDIQASLCHTADLHLKSGNRKTVQRLF